MGVYLYPSGTETELKNAYIGEYKEWEPGANTIGYRPLKSDLNDYSGNGRNRSVNTGSVSYANNMVTVNGRCIISSSLITNYSGDYTMFMYTKSGSSSGFLPVADNTYYPIVSFAINSSSVASHTFLASNTWYGASYNTDTNLHFIAGVRTSTAIKLYLDGQLVKTTSISNLTIKTGSRAVLGRNGAQSSGSCTVGGLVLENRAWTDQEIADYYNSTKSKYGIS